MQNLSAPKPNFLGAALLDLSRRPRGNVPCLDILRSAAILLVFSAHVSGFFSESPSLSRLPFVYWGWTGVDLFFILSGYLIGGQLWKELSRTGTVQVSRFILRRGFRIWPLYYTILLIALVSVLMRGQSHNGFITDFFFLSNYVDRTNVGGSWSLAIEEQFYIAFPLALWLGSRFFSPQRLIFIPIGWLIALPVIRAVIFHFKGVIDGSPFHTHSDGLALGLIIAWIAAFYPRRMKTPLMENALTLIGIVILALILRNGFSRHVFGYSSLALIYGGLALFLLRLQSPPGWFRWSWFYVISRLSYGIYLNHFFVLDHLPQILKPYIGGGATGFVLCWTVGFLVSATVAFVTFASVELPFLRIRESFLSKGAPNPSPQQVAS